MALEMEHFCPRCDAEETFHRTASTTLHLGEKTKWTCTECGYRMVLVNDTVDTVIDTST